MLTLKRNTLKKTAIALGTAVAMGGVVASANPAAAGHNPCHPAGRLFAVSCGEPVRGHKHVQLSTAEQN